ncbi:MAG: hypothetical protein WAK17_26465, partial [Candidatus Nitrosopolaris sp.]
VPGNKIFNRGEQASGSVFISQLPLSINYALALAPYLCYTQILDFKTFLILKMHTIHIKTHYSYILSLSSTISNDLHILRHTY